MREQGAVSCMHVLDGEEIVRVVVHTSDGVWQFMCGRLDHRENEGAMVGLNHLLEKDLSLEAIMDLPENFVAERLSLQSAWKRAPITE